MIRFGIEGEWISEWILKRDSSQQLAPGSQKYAFESGKGVRHIWSVIAPKMHLRCRCNVSGHVETERACPEISTLFRTAGSVAVSNVSFSSLRSTSMRTDVAHTAQDARLALRTTIPRRVTLHNASLFLLYFHVKRSCSRKRHARGSRLRLSVT